MSQNTPQQQPPAYKVRAARALLQVAHRLGKSDVPKTYRDLADVRLPGETEIRSPNA